MSESGAEAWNMRLLANIDLGGRGNAGEGMSLHSSRGRRTLFIAHERAPVNFSVVDVTDPARPELIAQTELPHDGVRSNSLSARDDILAVVYQSKTVGQSPAGMEIFDISNPTNPRSIGWFDTSGPHSRGAHFVWLSDACRAFIATGMPDYTPQHPSDDQIVVIVDLERPTHPQEIGRWWLPGTRAGDEEPPPERHTKWDSGFRAHNINVYPERSDRAFVGYLDAGALILDISDQARPSLVSRLDYHPPMLGFTHTVVPLFGRGLLAIADEALAEGCEDMPKNLWIADASDEQHPLIIAAAPFPPAENYCDRGGRFGMHNLHENDPTDVALRSEDLVFAALFNGGVRAFDIRNPFRPEEVAHFVPPAPAASPYPAIQMNDVYVDERGILYAVDRFGGGLYTIEALA